MSLVYRPGHPLANENGMVESHFAGAPPQAGRRFGKGPSVISDTMEPLKHMGTGRVLDSKSKFRADTRASGCVEVGNDPAALRARPTPEPEGVHMDVKRAMEELRSR
jgi:hypothetical protein